MLDKCLHGWIKEAALTLRKQDPALPENCALNSALNMCEECFKQIKRWLQTSYIVLLTVVTHSH